jgi:hypothetical protein
MQTSQTSKRKKVQRKKWNYHHAQWSFQAKLGHSERLRKYKDKLKDKIRFLILPPKIYLEMPGFIELLMKIRELSIIEHKTIYFDFTHCEEISVEACLVLLAEVERCGTISNSTMAGNFPKTIGAYLTLRDLGFYDYLHISRQKIPRYEDWEFDAKTILKIVSGRKSEDRDAGKQISQAIHKLLFNEAYAPEPSSDPTSRNAFTALTEAMQNSIDHAYPPTKDKKWLEGKWWMTGYKTSTNDLCLFFYDQGVGIPATVPIEWSEDVGTFARLFSRKPTDAELIKIATEVGRSQTGQTNRGKGLKELHKLIERHTKGGWLKITSGNGSYVFKGLNAIETHNINSGIDGTLIGWVVNSLGEELNNSNV